MARKKSSSRVLKVKKKSNLFKSIAFVLKDERFRKLSGILSFFIIAPYLFISFTSYLFTWDNDMSLVKEYGFSLLMQTDMHAENWLGRFGALISHLFIYDWFGISSYLFVLLTLAIGARFVFGITIIPIRTLLKHGFFILIWFSLALAYVFYNIPLPSEVGHLMGGAFGIACNSWLNGLIGNIGTGLLIVVSFFVYLILEFNISLIWEKNKADAPEVDKPITHINPHAGIELDASEGDANSGIDSSEEQNQQEITAESVEIELPVETGGESQQEMDKKKTDDDLTLTIEEGEKEEIKTATEIKDEQEFTEFDPTLELPSYQVPTVELLEDRGDNQLKVDKDELESNKNKIVETLGNYNIQIEKIKATIGPTVTLYEIVPAPGIRISKIKNLEDDIALSLSALGIRIIAPIPGRGTVGIEVPNKNPDIVSIKSVLSSDKFSHTEAALPIALGKTISNETLIADLAKMPHLLMAGATGQGKSVGLNTVLVSLLYKKHPSQVKFVLIDPKIVELTLYKKIERHFLAKLPDSESAIISDTKKVVHTLNSLVIEMEDRYKLLEDASVRNIERYNQKFVARKLNPEKGHRYLPYIVVVIDEFADLIMTAGKEIESPLGRLAQKARAIGIHLIIATQRPSVNIITGTIKANFPVRIAFSVTSKIDSRTILDSGGAEQLVGKGDMLFATGNDLIRIQCAFVDTPEVERITEFIGGQRGYSDAHILPEYIDESASGSTMNADGERDAQFEDAARIVVVHQQGSASLLQRKLKIGYNRAGRIIDQLEAEGIVGPFDGSKARQVLMPDEYSLEQFLSSNDKPDEGTQD